MKNIAALLIALASISLLAGIAFSSSVVFYLDENGSPYGYLDPNAYDIKSALDALPTPPAPWEAGRVLTSAVPPGTAVLDFRFEEDNQSFYREHVYQHCRKQADRWGRGMIAVPIVGYQGTA